MFWTHTLTALVASTLLSQQCLAQQARNLPALMDRAISPLEIGGLNKRSEECPSGGKCLIGECCGDGCSSSCCGHDNGGIGCSMGEKCSFEGNVFIGCCGIGAIGGCTGEATRVTINTPYSTVTFGSSTTKDVTATGSSQATATGSRSTASETTASQTTSGASPTESSSSEDAAESTTDMASSTSEGVAPMVTAFMPAGGVAILGAWMAL